MRDDDHIMATIDQFLLDNNIAGQLAAKRGKA